jgi:hypothetical protein
MLAALTMSMAKQQHETARAQRDQSMAAQEKADAAQVQDMRDKANLQRWQGAINGALEIGQGLCDVGKGLNEARAVNDTGKDLHDDKVRAAWFGGGAALGKAAESVSNGMFSGAITDKDADAKMHEASADGYKRMADDAHDAENDAKDLLHKALDFYKEYVDAKNQTAMAAIHRA